MEPQWTAYSEAPGNRYSHSMTSSPHASRDTSVSSQIKQDPYATPSRQSSMPLQSPSGTASRGPDYNDGDGDVPMEDAYKPRLNSMARPQQQQRHSQQYLQQEESAAARRYSPMNLSPTSPYSAGAQQAGQNYTSFTPQAQAQSQGNRQSPTRNNPYMSPPNNNNYYSPPCTSILCFGLPQS
ncbi:kinase-like protein [Alternaria alternata]|nr:kinase-like protein [Alternaria alternata]